MFLVGLIYLWSIPRIGVKSSTNEIKIVASCDQEGVTGRFTKIYVRIRRNSRSSDGRLKAAAALIMSPQLNNSFRDKAINHHKLFSLSNQPHKEVSKSIINLGQGLLYTAS